MRNIGLRGFSSRHAPRTTRRICAKPLQETLVAGEALSVRITCRSPDQQRTLRATLVTTANQTERTEAHKKGNDGNGAAITVGAATNSGGGADDAARTRMADPRHRDQGCDT